MTRKTPAPIPLHISLNIRHRRFLPGVTLGSLLSISLAADAAAQVVGIPGGAGGSAPAHMAKYYGYMLGKVFEITEDFEEAWDSGDRERLEEIYLPEARLMVDEGFPVRGREAIYDQLMEMFPRRWTCV